MRIRDLEGEHGWVTAFTDGSGLDNKAAGGSCSNPNSNQLVQTGDRYLGTKATHIDRKLEGIALALEGHKETSMLALLSDCKPAIRAVEKPDSGSEAPRSNIEARIQHALETRESSS